MHNSPSKNPGFTLTELMITLSIAGILLSLAVPSFNETINNNRLTIYTNELVTALNLARSEAVKRGIRVTLCKSSDGNICTNADDWSQGWILFIDLNNNAVYDNATETILKVHERLANNTAIIGNANVDNYVSYVNSGQSQLIGGGFQAGTIKVCDDRIGNMGKNIIINSVGRIRIETDIACP